MGDDRSRILELLAAGKITTEEAARLLDALDARSGEGTGTSGAGTSADADGAAEADGVGGADTEAQAKSGFHKFFPGAGVKTSQKTGGSGTPKFMYVKVVSVKGDNVNVKIPVAVMRAGLKPENISVSPECTSCSSGKYWSHRVTNGKRGSQASLIMMKGSMH